VYHTHGIYFLGGETQDSIGPPRYKVRGEPGTTPIPRPPPPCLGLIEF